MFGHIPGWFQAAVDILFAVEFLLVQIYLIWHLIRALFLR